MTPLIWLAIGLFLVCAEMFVGDLSMLMLGGGALAAAGVSLAGAPLWLEVVVFAAVTLALIAGLRPILRKKMLHSWSHREVESSPLELAGKRAQVIEEVNSNGGLVRVSGEFWSARALVAENTIPVDSTVTVVSIEGNTAIVDQI